MQLLVKRSPLSTTTPHVNREEWYMPFESLMTRKKVRRWDLGSEDNVENETIADFCKGPAWGGWILISWLSHVMSHVAPAVCAEDSGLCLPLTGWLIHSSSSSFKPSFLHTLVSCSTAVDSARVCACVCMHVYCTSSVRCNNILGECAGCKLLHNTLFLQLEDIDSEEKQWHE